MKLSEKAKNAHKFAALFMSVIFAGLGGLELVVWLANTFPNLMGYLCTVALFAGLYGFVFFLDYTMPDPTSVEFVGYDEDDYEY
jgi:hypothetical protein